MHARFATLVLAGILQGCAATADGPGATPSLGGELASRLDAQDRRILQQTLEYRRNFVSSAWHNDRSGLRFRATPVRTWQAADGRYCREYQLEVLLDGERRDVYDSACRSGPGAWEAQAAAP